MAALSPTLLATAKFAAVYIRVSTADQGERYSPASQKEKCLAKAHQDGYRVRPEHIFIDTVSGKSSERPALTRLRALVRTGAVHAVLVLSIDRLARIAQDAAMLAGEFQRRGVKLDFVEMRNDDSPEGKLIFGVMANMAEYTGAKIVALSRDGRRKMLQQNRIPGGPPVYGHNLHPTEKGRRVINEKEAAHSLEMFQMVDRGMSLYAVAADRNAKGILSKGSNLKSKKTSQPGLWSKNTVRQHLENTQCIGQYRSGEFVVDVPGFIPEDLFFRVNAKLQALGVKWNGRPSKKYLLTNFLFCHRCRHRYVGKADRLYRCYRCANRTNKPPIKNKCSPKQIRAEVIERVVWGAIWEKVTDPTMLLHEARAFYQEQPKPEDDARKELEAELQTLETQFANRKRMFRAGFETLDAAAEGEMRSLKGRIDFLRGELSAADPILQLPEEHIVQAYINDVKGDPEPTTHEGRRDILEGLKDLRVEYDREEGYAYITGFLAITGTAATSTPEGSNRHRRLTGDDTSTRYIPLNLKRRVA